MEYTGIKLTTFLETVELGTPLRIKLGASLDWEQTVYGGYKEFGGRGMYHIFFTLDRLEPRCAFSNDFFLRNDGKIYIDTNNNDAVEVATILKSAGIESIVHKQRTGDKHKTVISNNWFTDITNDKEMLGYFVYKETYKGIKILKDARDPRNGLIALSLPNNRIILLNTIRSRADAKSIIRNKIL